jgi:hypothetical protein
MDSAAALKVENWLVLACASRTAFKYNDSLRGCKSMIVRSFDTLGRLNLKSVRAFGRFSGMSFELQIHRGSIHKASSNLREDIQSTCLKILLVLTLEVRVESGLRRGI